MYRSLRIYELIPVIGDVLKNLKKTNNGFPTFQIDHVAYFKYGYLLFITKEQFQNRMMFSNDLQRSSNKPIHVFLIFKKPKHKPENLKYNWH